MNGMGYGLGMGFGWIMPLAIVALLFYVFRDRSTEELTAQEILNKRYANGGIDKEEYDEKSEHLRDRK